MPSNKYQKHRDRVAADQRDMAAAGRDIGPIPKVKNPKRRKRCERNLRLFLKTYYKEIFSLGWSPDHEKFLDSVQTRVLDGGRQAIAMPRGSGKTSILIAAAEWALLYGHRHFLALIAADGDAAEELADGIRIDVETNDLLLEDFPEVCFPVRALQGINQRANAQTCEGKRTHLRWKGKTLIFPTIPGSKASGAIVRVAGITGRIRGMSITTADGEKRRPDIVLVDDFQTDDSANSASQCATREKIISGAILGLAGPGKKAAAFASCTVIVEGDAADRILNTSLHKRWRGQRCKLVYEWPTGKDAEGLWARYLEIRSEELAEGDEYHPKATAFYKAHLAKMNEGAKVGWEDRKLPHELSALQHAYGLRDDNPDTFDAEYQNSPKAAVVDGTTFRLVTSDEIVLKMGAHSRGEVPDGAEWLTAGVDLQGSTLWWTIAAIDEFFRGWIIDRGVYPEQPMKGYYTLADVRLSYSQLLGVEDQGAAVQAALEALSEDLFSRRYNTPGGHEMRLDRLIADAGNWTDDVYEFCSNSDLAVLPSHGIGVTAKQVAWSTVKRKRGERRGFGWYMPKVKGTKAARHVNLDTNTWKSVLNRAWLAPLNAPASWCLFKSQPIAHRMFADNLTAEFGVETEGRGRKLVEWSVRPGRDNHWLDSTLLAAAAGVMLGASPPAVAASSAAARANSGNESDGHQKPGRTAKRSSAPRGSAAGDGGAARRSPNRASSRSTAARSGVDGSSGGSRNGRSMAEMRAAAKARRQQS